MAHGRRPWARPTERWSVTTHDDHLGSQAPCEAWCSPVSRRSLLTCPAPTTSPATVPPRTACGSRPGSIRSGRVATDCWPSRSTLRQCARLRSTQPYSRSWSRFPTAACGSASDPRTPTGPGDGRILRVTPDRAVEPLGRGGREVARLGRLEEALGIGVAPGLRRYAEPKRAGTA